MNKRIIILACVFGVIGVILGAFGAHALRSRLGDDEMRLWKTGIEYQFYHTLALLFLSTFSSARNNILKLSAYSFAAGILFFSGSLYLLAIRQMLGSGWAPVLGPVTPLGGLFFIAGWVFLFLAALKNNNA